MGTLIHCDDQQIGHDNHFCRGYVGKMGAFHFGQFTDPVGAIPPWLLRNLGDRSQVKCSRQNVD